MRKTIETSSIACLLALTPAFASAQTLEAVCEAVMRVEPGQWAEYSMTGTPMGGAASMWMGHVGTKAIDGVDHMLYEWRLTGAQNMTMQMAVTGDGGPWDMGSVVEMRMQAPGQPPMTMSGSMLEMARQQGNQAPNIADECASAEVIGNESITVPAGTMRTLHIRHEQGEAWASMDVPFGLVRMVSPEGGTIELKAHGSGATSSMNE